MNREIKFRLINNGKIVGYEEHKVFGGKMLIFHDDANISFSCIADNYIPHDSKEQFTGLKDVNGVEIYEGDIVKGFWQCDYKSCRIGVVKYWEQFGLYGLEEKAALVSIVWQGCEVIGIHENPDQGSESVK